MDDLRILPMLGDTVRKYHQDRAIFRTLVVLFEGPADSATHLSEEEFESHLWARAQSLSDKDAWLGHRPDPSVSADPDDPHFSREARQYSGRVVDDSWKCPFKRSSAHG